MSAIILLGPTLLAVCLILYLLRLARDRQAWSQPLFTIAVLVVTSLCYYLTTELAWKLCFPDSKVCLIFPPHAVLVSILLLVPTRYWWACVLAAMCGHLLASQQAHWTILESLHCEAFNTVQNVLTAAGLRRFIKSPLKQITLRDAIVFLLVAVVVVPVATAFWGAAYNATHFGTSYWIEWRNLSISNGVTAVVFVPAILLGVNQFMTRRLSLTPARTVEALFLGAAIIALGLFVFDYLPAGPASSPNLLYAQIPLLIWASLRFGLGGTSVAVLLVTLQAILGTMHGHGPFLARSPEENALALQLFLLVSAAPLMLLAVVFEEERRSESSVRESEKRFRTVADVAPVMIWMSGTEKEGVFFNKGWLEFTGRRAEEELGEGWLKGVHPDDLAHTLEICGTAFGKREPFTVEYRLRRKDGEYRWLLDTGTPRSDDDGAFLGYVGSCIDIGDRKQAELDNQLQSMELARVGRLALMGELAASLAHEINNPLGAMVTNASAGQLMVSQGQTGTDEFQELLADIVSDGHRAREVIEGIRNMVRKTDPSHALVEIKDVVRDLVRIVRADALAKKVNLITEVDPNVAAVLGDRVQLLQVLLNLTINAFEAMSIIRADARRVVISAKCIGEGTVCLSVRDAGPGLPGGIADHLFEPFFSTKKEGTGMGLAIARSIVEAHRGTLTAESCPDGGARFTVCLPEARAMRSRAA